MTSGGNNFSNIPENKRTKFCALASCYCLLPLPSPVNTPDNPIWTSDGWGCRMKTGGGVITPRWGLDKSLLCWRAIKKLLKQHKAAKCCNTIPTIMVMHSAGPSIETSWHRKCVFYDVSQKKCRLIYFYSLKQLKPMFTIFLEQYTWKS